MGCVRTGFNSQHPDFKWVDAKQAKKYDLIEGIHEEIILANKLLRGENTKVIKFIPKKMKISEIYDKYHIMPNLQEHMLRVAGVALLICDNFKKIVDSKSVVAAALLHDSANIIKFDFEWTIKLFPDSFDDQSLKYWKNIQKKLIDKYGDEEHLATYKIIEELGISTKVLGIVKAYGFSQAEKTLETDDYEVKIAAYSDHRVSPSGVTSLYKRHSEARERYAEGKNAKRTPKEFDKLARAWRKIEKQIFAHCKIKPNEITEEKVQKLFSQLKSYEINTA